MRPSFLVCVAAGAVLSLGCGQSHQASSPDAGDVGRDVAGGPGTSDATGAAGREAAGAAGTGAAGTGAAGTGAAGTGAAGTGAAGTGSAGSTATGVAGAGAAGSGSAGTSPMADGGATDGRTDVGAGDTGAATTKRIVGGYYPNWTPSPARLRDVDGHYNLIYLFAATPVGGAPGTTGAVTFTLPGDGRGAATHFKEDIAYARAMQHRTIMLSVGGAGHGMSFPTRAKSTTFVTSIVGLYDDFGPFDGLDWNTFEATQAPDTAEMIWISLQLKQRYPGFLVSAPPAPWNQRDKDFCKAMLDGGALDYAAPQYYDGPNLATQSYITKSVGEWAALLGASKVVVGFGVWDQPNYMSIADAVSTWKALAAARPALRGAFDWQINTDETQGWPFAQQLGPLVGATN